MIEKAAPDPFTTAELKGAKILREKLGQQLPPEFNTDFFLARWWRAYKGDDELIERRLIELVNHRNAMGYNSENVLEQALTLDFARKTLERFTISRFHMEVFSDDVAVFVHKMEGSNLKEMIRLYLLHPPGFLSLMWQIAKHIVDAKTQSSIVFVEKIEDLKKYLAVEAIPVEYGGTRRDDTGFATTPESCVRNAKQVLETDYFKADQFWREHGFRDGVPDMKSVSIKSKHIHEISKDVKAGQKILWQFTVNADFAFEIIRVGPDGKEYSVWPKIVLTSLKVPEHGFVHCLVTGEYRVRWTSASSSWLPSKLTYTATTK